MELKRNGVPCASYESSYNGQKIIIAIDSSKSNTAIVVGNEYKEILDDFEISGAGSDIDVYQLCWDTRKALKQLFDGADIIAVGIENIITKNEKGYKGIEVHQSRAKITAVFDNLIFFFQDCHSIMPKLINNQEWKSHTLPSEFRTREHKKGSKDYFQSIGSKYAHRADDVTDAVCIFNYLCTMINLKVVYQLKDISLSSKPFEWGLYPITTALPQHSKEFAFDKSYTVEQCSESIASQLSDKDAYGYTRIDIENVPLDIIFSERLHGKYPKGIDQIYLVVALGK